VTIVNNNKLTSEVKEIDKRRIQRKDKGNINKVSRR
ncbi:unnamed protein product, partial [marine sediment metagenome]